MTVIVCRCLNKRFHQREKEVIVQNPKSIWFSMAVFLGQCCKSETGVHPRGGDYTLLIGYRRSNAARASSRVRLLNRENQGIKKGQKKEKFYIEKQRKKEKKARSDRALPFGEDVFVAIGINPRPRRSEQGRAKSCENRALQQDAIDHRQYQPMVLTTRQALFSLSLLGWLH